MRKIFLSLILISLLVMPTIGLALTIPQTTGQTTTLPEKDVFVVLNNIANWLFYILVLIAVIAILIAAFLFVTSSGDPEKVGSARQFILYALVGIMVGLLAKGLVLIVGKITE